MPSAISNAVKKGFVTIHPISYPVIIATRNFANWNKSAFGADNNILSVPQKAELRKVIKDAIVHLTLGTMLSDGQLGNDPSIEEVSKVFSRVQKNINSMMPSSKPIEERDMILCRAYVRALKDFQRRNTKLKKFLDKNPFFLEVPKPSKSRPKKSSSKSIGKRKSKRTATQNKKLKAEIKSMIKSGEVRKLSSNPRRDSDFVDLYLSSASLSQAKAQTPATKKKAASNRRKLMKSIKK